MQTIGCPRFPRIGEISGLAHVAGAVDIERRAGSARNGPEALAIIRRRGDIDLLFTDVVMPGGMNGRQLADAVLSIRPGVRVLYTSGYSENAIVHHGRLDPGVHLLGKPYRRSELAAKVREALAGESQEGSRVGPK